jgi:hypothetical protein
MYQQENPAITEYKRGKKAQQLRDGWDEKYLLKILSS